MTVREATFAVMRELGLTRIFGNPGSTEIPFLTNLPGEFEFVLGLHEGAVVGMATGYALARERPAFVNLHTAPGLGNAINAIANARDCAAPLVVVVGQQDRRQIAFEPFLTGRELERLAGEYPVFRSLPLTPQDVPGTIARAHHEALAGRGPALVVVPMGDWEEPAGAVAAGTPAELIRPQTVAADELGPLVELLEGAAAPALVAGAGADGREGWEAIVALAERLACPVWQESFTFRAGFPQDHPQFAGHLPWRRAEMRRTLAPHDAVVAVGTGAFRLYLLDDPGPFVAPGTRVAVIAADARQAHRSPCEVAVVADVAAACRALAGQLAPRGGREHPGRPLPPAPPPPGPGEPLRPGHVFAALAERLPADAVLVEETPSSQPELYERYRVRSPAGFFGTANGGLGFGLSGAIGLRLGMPDRPVVAVLGDGSSLYAIQGLWSAARYGIGTLFIVLANGGYAVMDAQARARGASWPWPGFAEVDITGLAASLGCPSRRVSEHEDLLSALDDALAERAAASRPLVLEVAVAA